MKNIVYIEGINTNLTRGVATSSILINGLKCNYNLALQGFIIEGENNLVMVCSTDMNERTIDLFKEDIRDFVNSLVNEVEEGGVI